MSLTETAVKDHIKSLFYKAQEKANTPLATPGVFQSARR
jgi:hypothetical protein